MADDDLGMTRTMTFQAPGVTAKEAEKVKRNMQIKSFTKFINYHLAKRQLSIEDILKDFEDGTKLINLLEVLSEESLGKYDPNPNSKFKKVANLNKSMEFINGFISKNIKSAKTTSQLYMAEHVLDENETMILGMIFSIITRFVVGEVSEGDKTAKEGLLLWAKKKVEEGSSGKTTVTNFHTSWQDGMAFCALINALRPDMINYGAAKLSKDKKIMQDNLNMAFDAAEKLGIPRLLDAEDMTYVKPDEKAVMTYIGFFWQEFASNKKKNVAAELLTKRIQRELDFEGMQAEYVSRATALVEWLQETQARLSKGPESNDAKALQVDLDAYLDFGRNGRPAKIQEFADIETLLAATNSRLRPLGGRSYTPPEAISPEALKRLFEELHAAERAYETAIKGSLQSIKKMDGLVRMFKSRAEKTEAWLGSKAAWVSASHATCRASLKPEALDEALDETATGGLPTPPPSPPPSPGAPPSPPPSPPELARAQTASRLADATKTLDDLLDESKPSVPWTAEAEGSTSPSKEPPKRPSLMDQMGKWFSTTFGPKDEDKGAEPLGAETSTGSAAAAAADVVAAAATVAAEASDGASGGAAAEPLWGPAAESEPLPPTLAKQVSENKGTTVAVSQKPMVLTKKASNTFFKDLKVQEDRQKGAALDSIAAVNAKINLLQAHETDQADREKSVLPTLTKIYTELESMSFPHLELLAQRKAALTENLAQLAAAAASYRTDLEALLDQLKAIEAKQLTFAQRAEAFARWTEEATDSMSEVMQIETPKEADVVDAEISAFRTQQASKAAELTSLTAIEGALASSGANPYSRYLAADLAEAMAAAVAAADERAEMLATERERMATVDGQKRQFAAAAEAALAFLSKERAALDENTPPLVINPDDADALAKGKAMLAWLEDYSGKWHERSVELAPAQELSDALFAAAELDNPYTAESMASLKAAYDQLEKVVRDKLTYVNAELTRALVNIAPEEYDNLKKTFEYFDKNKSGALDKLEFKACVQALDYEGVPDDAFDKGADGTAENADTGETEPTISFEPFVTIMLQQYKDTDSIETLVAAFHTLSGEKPTIEAGEYRNGLAPAHADYLGGKLTEASEGGLDYMPFCRFVYNASAAA